MTITAPETRTSSGDITEDLTHYWCQDCDPQITEAICGANLKGHDRGPRVDCPVCIDLVKSHYQDKHG